MMPSYIRHSLSYLCILFLATLMTISGAMAQPATGCSSNCEIFGDSCCLQNEAAVCINTKVSHSNCGTCGNQCDFYESCFGGVCRCPSSLGYDEECLAGETCVSTGCTNLQTDPANCGTENNRCGSGQMCRNGQCVTIVCAELCAGVCTDPNSDVRNCGACGLVCPSGNTCIQGQCRITCPAGQVRCGGKCVDLVSDEANCGACGVSCPPGSQCTGPIGRCSLACPPGQTACNGVCSDLDSDPNNCGACGEQCIPGSKCNGSGQCQLSCSPGFTNCNGACTNLDTDRSNCGACGVSCPLGTVCNGSGQCVISCQPGEARCGSSCVDLDTDNSNCGSCGISCPEGTRCSGSGSCTYTCSEGTSVCDGACVNFDTDKNNCGSCGNACQSAENCLEGVCTLSTTPASAASPVVFIPFWSLKDADTNLVLHAVDSPADVLIRFYDSTGVERKIAQLSLSANYTRTLRLRDLGLQLDDFGAGSIVIEPAPRAFGSGKILAETNVYDEIDKVTYTFTHIALIDGAWTKFAKSQKAPVAILDSYRTLLFCPANDLASKLLALGELPGRPSSGFSSKVDFIIRDADGAQLIAPRLLCDSVTFVRPAELFVDKTGKPAIDLEIEASVDLSTPRLLEGTTGQRVPEDSRFIAYSINAPQPDKTTKRIKEGEYDGQYMSE